VSSAMDLDDVLELNDALDYVSSVRESPPTK
jgi:hypothetical protein